MSWERIWRWTCDGCGRVVEVLDRGFPYGWTYVSGGMSQDGSDIVTHRCHVCSPTEQRARTPRDSYAADTPVEVREPTLADPEGGGRVAACPSHSPESGASGSRSP